MRRVLWSVVFLVACGEPEDPCKGLVQADCQAEAACAVMTGFDCLTGAEAYGGCMERAVLQEEGCGDAGAVMAYDGVCMFYTSTCVPDDAEECPTNTAYYDCY